MPQSSPSCTTLSSTRDQTVTQTTSLPLTRSSARKKSSRNGAKIEDYDPTKFSAFACSLVGMDPLKAFNGASSQERLATSTLGASNGRVANGGGGSDVGMDLSASGDTLGVPEVPNNWLSSLNTSHAQVDDAVTHNIPTVSNGFGNGIQGVQNGTSNLERTSNGSEALLDMQLDLDSDSLQQLFLLSQLPAESAPLAAVDGHPVTMKSLSPLSRLIENLTPNHFDLESSLNQESNPNQNGVVDQSAQNAHNKSFSDGCETTSHIPHLLSHSNTSFSYPESSHALSFTVPSPNIAATSMEEPHNGALSSTSDPNMWNSWQHCNADSIRMWLQSTSVAGT